MEKHEEMGIYLLVDTVVYQAHYKAGEAALCRDCELMHGVGGCLISGKKRIVCAAIDCYWRTMDE